MSDDDDDLSDPNFSDVTQSRSDGLEDLDAAFEEDDCSTEDIDEEPPQEVSESSDSESDLEDESTNADPLAEPAFGSDQTVQYPLYIREGRKEIVLNDLRQDVQRDLRKKHGIRGKTDAREFHEAMVDVAEKHKDEIVEVYAQKRREENSN